MTNFNVKTYLIGTCWLPNSCQVEKNSSCGKITIIEVSYTKCIHLWKISSWNKNNISWNYLLEKHLLISYFKGSEHKLQKLQVHSQEKKDIDEKIVSKTCVFCFENLLFRYHFQFQSRIPFISCCCCCCCIVVTFADL